MASMHDVLAIIMGGGVGKRLHPLTRMRAKPAVPIAGKYRLIDVPLSNCINSGIQRIAVLTQFNSVSLHRHITSTYQFDSFHPGWVQILAAEQTPQSSDWYQGTADAVRKQLTEIIAARSKYVLILAGDHLYRMDYELMTEHHIDTHADVTVAVQPVPASEASRFGILKQTSDGKIVDFVEKPKDPDTQRKYISRSDPDRPFLGSMGIYMFNVEVLIDLLNSTDYTDFGGDVIPHAIETHKVYGYSFDDYWEDIGTIRSFYETNLSLTRPDPPFNIYDAQRPIYTRARYLPGSIISGGTMSNALITDGCIIRQANISNSIIGLRSIIADGASIRKSYVMGADYYDVRGSNLPGGIPIGIGPGSDIEGAIIDKNVRMGAEVVIRPFPPGTEIDGEFWAVRDGIVVISKSSVVPSGTVIAP